MLFLIEYDRGQGKIITIQRFNDLEQRVAEKARLELELEQNRLGGNHEIVLMEAVDESTLRRTHRRYFETLDELAKAS